MIATVFWRNILQMVAIQRPDTLTWAIPGGFVDKNEKAIDASKREFFEEALNSRKGTLSYLININPWILSSSLQFELANIFIQFNNHSPYTVPEIEAFFNQSGTKIYTGYVDDPRNTDNAWVETAAYNFHDYSGEVLRNIELEAGDDAGNAKWLDLNRSVDLYASHKYIASKVAKRLHAHWWKHYNLQSFIVEKVQKLKVKSLLNWYNMFFSFINTIHTWKKIRHFNTAKVRICVILVHIHARV